MMGLRKATTTCVLVALVMLTTACPRRGSKPDDGTFDRAGRDGMSERGLSGSLARAQRGLPPEEDGILRDVHFDYDGFELAGEARRVIDANVAWLRENEGAKVELEGHCDDRGTIEYNLALGARRAKAVKDYLLMGGIAPDRLATISYGEELPVCQDQSEACWARNRRVHFVVLGQ